MPEFQSMLTHVLVRLLRISLVACSSRQEHPLLMAPAPLPTFVDHIAGVRDPGRPPQLLVLAHPGQVADGAGGGDDLNN